MITTKPIPWGPLPNPWTLTGDEIWKDYEVTTDVNIASGGMAALLGRIESADIFAEKKALWPAGYLLTIRADGQWTLTSNAYKKPTIALGAGASDVRPGTWHHALLRFAGDTITAQIDGRTLLSVHDDSHKQGMVGIGCDWTRTQFASLSVH